MSGERHDSGRVHPNLILAVLSLAGLAYAVLSSAVIPALPTFQKTFHASETEVAWLLTGFLLSASVGTSIIGRLGDMYGKERLLLWTLLVLAAGTLLAAVSQSLGMLIVARVIQGVAGGIFPLAFSIARDEFPADKVAGSIGLMSAILGVGAGFGLVLGALIVEHLGWHWLFWIPFVVTLLAAFCTRRYIPESPVRSPGRVNWLAAGLMTIGISGVLIAIAQTTVWGWGSPKTLALFAFGFVFCALWVAVEVRSRQPLVDMTMMRIRGVWTTNLAAFLLGAGMYSSFIVFPQFAQLPKSTGFGFGATIVVSSLYLLPAALAMGLLGAAAGRVARRFGSKHALVAGTAISAVAFGYAALAHSHPYNMLITTTLLGIGIGLAFAALGNLIVQAVPPTQTGVASGVNTVMRTLGGALGGQTRSDLHRRQHCARSSDGDRFRRQLRPGDCVPGRLRVRCPARPGPERSRRVARARSAVRDRAGGRLSNARVGANRMQTRITHGAYSRSVGWAGANARPRETDEHRSARTALPLCRGRSHQYRARLRRLRCAGHRGCAVSGRRCAWLRYRRRERLHAEPPLDVRLLGFRADPGSLSRRPGRGPRGDHRAALAGRHGGCGWAAGRVRGDGPDRNAGHVHGQPIVDVLRRPGLNRRATLTVLPGMPDLDAGARMRVWDPLAGPPPG